jgi:hypothetical protein
MHLVLVGKFRSKIPSIAAVSVIGAFAVIGLSYSLMPADEPSMLLGWARTYIQNFGLLSMQFNSVDIEDNKNLLS